MIKSINEKKSTKLEIDLTGPDGNAWMLMGIARSLIKELNKLRGNEYLNEKEILADMKSGDYEHLLEIMEKHFGHIITMYR
jgi:hypothetical protein